MEEVNKPGNGTLKPLQFEYTIGGKVFIQKPLVLGQTALLFNYLRDLKLKNNLEPQELMALLGNKIYSAIAIVLLEKSLLDSQKSIIEQCEAVKSRDIYEVTCFMEMNLESETALQIVIDFFELNPISSVVEKFLIVYGNFKKMTNQVGTGVNKSLQYFRGETLPKVTSSSGDTHLESVNHASNGGKGK